MTTKAPERRVHRATVTSKGQLTLPKALRERLRLESGSVVDFVEEGDTVTLQPVRRRRSFTEALGTLEPLDGMTAEEYVSDMRHGAGDREILQSGPGVRKITYIEDLLK